MTAKDLYDILKIQVESCGKGDQIVGVKLCERTIGATPIMPIALATAGFDWNCGKFILYPEKPVVRKT